VLIKRHREAAHRRVMVSCFVVSTLFLISYLTYHYHVGHTRFSTTHPVAVRWFYLGMLLTHVVLAVPVPFLALGTIVLGYRDARAAHRRLARWTFPIWLYVSVTGVLVYCMLYWLYPSPSTT
jgi:putative membrane protein